MLHLHDLGAIQRAADYVTVRKRVRVFGIGATVFGAIALVLAAVPPPGAALLVIGMMLFATGVWNLSKPAPIGLILGGITLVVVGVDNIVETFTVIAHGQTVGTTWAVVGCFQILWGGQEIFRFKRFRRAFDARPNDATLEQAEQLMAGLRKARPKEEEDVIQLVAHFTTHMKAIRARLLPQGVLCIVGSGEDVIVAAREHCEIWDAGKVTFGNKRNVDIAFGEFECKGQIPVADLERFEMWKQGGTPLARAA